MSVVDTVAAAYNRIERAPLHPVWISLVPRKAALDRLSAVILLQSYLDSAEARQ